MTRGNGHDQRSNVASLDEARRRAEQKAREQRRAAPQGGGRTTRDYLIGGTLIVMALGYLASLVVPLVRG